MPKDANVIGREVARLRNQRCWSQSDLVAELHLLGCINMTREILANIEIRRSPATDKHIEFFAEVFGIMEQELFPKKRHFVGKEVGMDLRIFTRRRNRSGSSRS
jgi:transcriptional regulator with XRE-family HTH domain